MYVLFVVQEHKLGPRYFYARLINEKCFNLQTLFPFLLFSAFFYTPHFSPSLKATGSAGCRKVRQCGLGRTE